MEISTTKVAQVIVLARELDRAKGEFIAFVDRLSEDEQAELVALMWVGRGSYEIEDLGEAIKMAFAEASTPTASYLLGTPHLSDHLETALEALNVSAMELENELM
ncbi:DUF3775 domain-containing protein [Planktotalea sp.]|uniref:DUF3775 domain-containing protein n=1 Tax=Planktotalea sp. TaxID=2029877 RepID=UPI003D6A112C